MAKIKRLVLGLIPNNMCNLRCEYCYISQVEAWDKPMHLKYPVEYIVKCLSIKRLGGVALINLTGNGETLIQPDIVDLIVGFLKEGHYVEVVTNGTITKNIDKILAIENKYLKHLFFKISFHYKELERLNLIEEFFYNIKNIKKSGASFTLELMAYDGIEKDINIIKEICIKNVGAVCQATIGINDARKDKGLLSSHSVEEFRKIWKPLNSPMLEFKLNVLGKKRKEFCYAGDWSLFVNLFTGEAQPCYWQPYNQNIFKNPNEPIKFYPIGHFCTNPYCTNAHAHMTWGLLPSVGGIPTYSEMRNRIEKNGNEWLSSDCKKFFESKLYESNEQYSKSKQIIYTIFYPFLFAKWFIRDWKNNIFRIKKYLIRIGS